MATNPAINGDAPVGVGGWLLLYLCASIPYLLFHSAGLSGLFGYPLWLLVAIFLLLASPLALILRKSPRAPRWNIVALWVVALSITLRAAAVPFTRPSGEAASRRSPGGMGRRDRDPRGHRGRVAGMGGDLDGLLPAIGPRAEHPFFAGGGVTGGWRASPSLSSAGRPMFRIPHTCAGLP